MGTKRLSCADCAVVNCDVQNKKYPSFCLTTHMDEETKRHAMERYEGGDNRRSELCRRCGCCSERWTGT